jgi:5-methylcytosine-specific restriction endonuclease McrA
MVMPYKDLEKARECRRKWKKANADKQREYVKKSQIKCKAINDALPEVIAKREAYRLKLIDWEKTREERKEARRLKNNENARARRAKKAKLEGRELGRRVMSVEEKREKKRINRKNREYAERNAEGKLSVGIRGRLLKLQKGLCIICRNKLILHGEKKYHMDHIVPISGGGTNYDENIQLLCAGCNVAKSNKDNLAFMQTKGYLL